MDKVPRSLPDSPGVYLMKDAKGRILYVGKAGNLKRRVSSYFLRSRLRQGYGGQAHDSRIEKLTSEIRKVGYKKTDTAMEALILEAELIKRYEPPYNVSEKDDKSFLYVGITKEKFPRVLLVRGKAVEGERLAPSLTEHLGNRSALKREERSAWFSAVFGPFTSASNIRQAIRIIRKIFPFSVHPADKVGKMKRGCFDYELGLCPGTCLGIARRDDYFRNIKNIKLFFRGGKKRILTSLKKAMNQASKDLEFENAEKIRRQIFALKHIQDIAFITEPEFRMSKIKPPRIEGYDVSNISGTSAVGSMVVFVNGRPALGEYKKFRIKTVFKPDDTAMIKEVLCRRLKNEWTLPDLILIDGGKPQVNAAGEVLNENGVKIPIIGIAKGSTRKKNEFIGRIPKDVSEKTLIRVRDEAHRFAISYHKKVRDFKFKR